MIYLSALLRAPRTLRLLVAAVGMTGFVLVVGSEPSEIRAALMAEIGLFALVTGRSGQSLTILAAVVLMVSLASPATAQSLGFILSVTATVGIVLFAKKVEKIIMTAQLRCARTIGKHVGMRRRSENRQISRRHPARIIAAILALAIVAHVATAPVLLLAGAAVSPWAILKNALVAPVVPWVTVAGTAAAATGPVFDAAGRALSWLTWPALWWIQYVAEMGN